MASRSHTAQAASASEAAFGFRKRPPRVTPMRRLRFEGEALAAARGEAAVDFPGFETPEEAAGRRRWLTGSLAALIHGALIGTLLLLTVLAPPEEDEVAIPVQLLQELEQAKEEPAPAPKALAERRSVNFAPSPQALAPQVVNPTVVAKAVPVAGERIEVDTAISAVAPRQIQTTSVAVRAVQAVTPVAAPATPLMDLEASTAPALRGPVESVAPVGPSAGPRAVPSGGATVGTGPVDLGDGSSVKEGIVTTRDVLGSSSGPRLASVNTRVGKGYLYGTGGSGTGVGGSAPDCFERPEVQAYWEQIKTRMYTRWVLPPNLPPGVVEVKLRFRLDPGGSAQDIQLVKSESPLLGRSATEALRSASPFPPMSDRVRCLADSGLLGTFRKLPETGTPRVAN